MLSTLKFSVKHWLNQVGVDVRRADHIPFGFDYCADIKYCLDGQKVETIFDVGANVGQTSLYLLKHFPDASIFAFEPVPNTYKKLEANLSHISQVQLSNMALGNSIGELPMTNIENSLLNTCRLESQLESEKESQIVRVNINTIDNFCQENRISHIHLLKTDTEGFDLNVLKGAENLLRNQKIDFIFSECRFFQRRETDLPGDFVDLLNYLQGLNYNFVTLYTEAVDDLGFVFGNVLFRSTINKKAQRFSFSPLGSPINWYR